MGEAAAVLLCVLVGAAGWHYMFYSQAAQRLHAAEGSASNRWRVRLRRVGGAAMLLLGLALAAALWGLQAGWRELAMLGWLAVPLLLLALVVLAAVDVWLTRRLWKKKREQRWL